MKERYFWVRIYRNWATREIDPEWTIGRFEDATPLGERPMFDIIASDEVLYVDRDLAEKGPEIVPPNGVNVE